MLFWNSVDLEIKLSAFRNCYNFERVHSENDGATPFEIQDDKGKKPKGKKKKPKKIDEKTARALLEFLARAAREAGGPCCQNSLGVLIGDIGLERKLKSGKFETPQNGVFDDDDTIRVSFGVLGCPPLAVRIDLQDPTDNTSDRVLKEDNVTRGADLKVTQKFPRDPATSRYTKEIDLSASSFSSPSTPASIVLQISVKDDCGRIGTFPVPVTFVDTD